MRIVGREEEQMDLQEYYDEDRPEFLVVYGRRRIGKTYLIREFFGDRFCFHATGLSKAPKSEQLREFNYALNKYGDGDFPVAGDWFTAFHQLRKLIEKSAIAGKKVIFLDEMPWMDTHKSRFISGLESFWNGWASGRPDILLIVCGSSTAWITKKLFRNTGGLYNRVTRRMYLRPFTLKECEEFFDAKGIVYSRQQMVESYMIFGGVPYYLNLMEKRFGLPQNVDLLCFSENGALRGEFDELYASLFENPERHIRIIEAIAKKARGLSREEIVKYAGVADGGGLTKALDELARSDFVRKYYAYGKKERDVLYQLCDPFTLFFLKFMRGNPVVDENYWTHNINSGGRNAWNGYAFEQVCLAHITQIKRKLGILGVSTRVASWRSKETVPGAQIDLVIERGDRVINLCEIKYADKEYEITKDYDEKLRRKRWAFEETLKSGKALHTTLITLYGVKRNKYRFSVQSEVLMDDLFA
ncbi:MAG: AAA family ATPase [Clostridiales Family XIII bacterium]|jgi:AAA+ ATPase superfamily predicted ATPase|nr:AAA family ATPase [Clostridiales Family XIII bacterium]